MIKSLSFCIMAAHRSQEALARCIQSIQKQNISDYEIMVGGVNLESTEQIAYLYRVEWERDLPILVGEIQNEFCKRAVKDFIVLIDANVELSKTWYSEIKQADCFDVIGSALSNTDGKRVIDWAILDEVNGQHFPVALRYDEWTKRAFVSGSLMVIRRRIWDEIEFEENMNMHQFEDADFCHRAAETGFRLGVWPDAKAIYHTGQKSKAERPFLTFDEAEVKMREQPVVVAEKPTLKKSISSTNETQPSTMASTLTESQPTGLRQFVGKMKRKIKSIINPKKS